MHLQKFSKYHLRWHVMICLFYVEESISGYNVQVHEWFDLDFVWRNKSLTNNYVFVILPNYGEYGMPKTITGSTTFVIYPPLWLTNCTWHYNILQNWWPTGHYDHWIYANLLTHWGQVTHICVGKLTNIGSDNGLSRGRRQPIIWTNAGILLIEPLY